MQETFPPSTVFPGGVRRLLISSLDSSTAGKQTQCWNSNPFRFQLLTLSQSPGEQLSCGPAGSLAARDEPLTKTSASPKQVQDLIKKRESHDHPRESKLVLPAESEVQGAGLLGFSSRAGRHCQAPAAESSICHVPPSCCLYFGDSV